MSNDNPWAGPTASPGPSEPPFANFGHYFSIGFQVYFQRWKDWIVPMLVAAGVMLAALICCYFPVFLVAGPLGMGLYVCALETLRGRPISAGTLWRGWPLTWSAMGGWIAMQLLVLLPMLLIQGLFMAMFMLVIPMADGGGHGQPGGPPETLMIVLMLGSFALLMIGGLGCMIWSFWLSTRTMFVLPLIADLGVDFSTAWKMSWDATRRGFWELLLLQFLAGLIGGLGAYACYVGVIFTLPIHFTLVAVAYEHRFAANATVT